MLQIKDLCFFAEQDGREAEILNGVNLSVPDGHFVVITGPNGSGKTTLARAIMGIIKPTSGKILWGETDVTDMSVTQRARLGISYGFQQPPRFKGLLVHDLLSMASGRDIPHSEACKYLTQVGLCANDYIDRELNASLSGGEIKRIEIATVLAKNSPLMIFDEPEAGIDLWSFSKLTGTFGQIRERGDATIIVISHQEHIISMADEVVLLAGGRVAKQGTPDEILPEILSDTFRICSVLEGA